MDRILEAAALTEDGGRLATAGTVGAAVAAGGRRQLASSADPATRTSRRTPPRFWPALAPAISKPWDRSIRAGMALTDLALIVIALVVARVVRFGDLGATQLTVGPRSVDYQVVGVVITILWFLTLTANDSRKRRVLGAGLEEYRRILTGTVAAFGALAMLSYLGEVTLSRLYFVVALPVGLGLLLVGRLAWRLRLRQVRSRGHALTGTVVVGDADDVVATVAEMRRHREAGYVPVAIALSRSGEADPRDEVLPELPRISLPELSAAAEDPRLGAVMIAGGISRAEVRQLAWDLEVGSAELLLVSQLTDVAGPRIHQVPVDGLPMVQVDLPRFSGWAHVLKRSMDVVFAATALLLLAPVYGAIALAIKADDGGPVFFRQERVGQNGTSFMMHKFRTMAVDAEARLAALQGQGDGNGVLFKLKDDPRVTRVGKFLRRYSLDEFPQFFDVLTGQMSVVGPRPPLASEVECYERHVHRRLLTKPGVTGLWQVSGRSDLSWEESVRLDLSYVENWSVSGDLMLILRTVRAVIRPRGAY